MSKLAGPVHWICDGDKCHKDGGIVDERETLPYRWLSLHVLIGTPQIAEEQRTDRLVHLCDECGWQWLCSLREQGDVSRLLAIFNRPDKP